ncbi:MAG: DEAD/DEAH box helicase [Armatimonadetes bacterium]|nr:DEAD/DEAH box helicase [Armatimonadota bacterium]
MEPAPNAVNFRPYQPRFVDAVLGALVEFDRVLGVAPTGSGKTVMAGEICRRCLPFGPVLFLADAQELVHQAADKLGTWAGVIPQVEMAESEASPGDRLVVATTQSMARRLEKWPRDYFALLIVDEAHRNTLGAMAGKVLGHFCAAQVIGITATPFRADKQQLGSFYEHVAHEISLVELIRDGFLARIVIKSVPVNIDLRGVRTTGGDYREDDLGRAVQPHLGAAARLIAEHAPKRRTVVFVPLIETSKAFVAECRAIGLRAVHVDGGDRSALAGFRRGEADIISNSALLTTGWDEPSVDCVMVLRPTKSLVLYSQMIGRGTRIHPGKADLLVLDPLYLSDTMDLIRPARLIAETQEQADAMTALLAGGRQLDLLEVDRAATEDRKRKLAEQLAEKARRKTRTVDAVEFALRVGADDFLDYEPTMPWEALPPSPRQLEVLAGAGFDAATVTCKGMASKILDLLFRRRALGLATPKQVRWLVKLGHPSPNTATFEEAARFLDSRFGARKREPAAA